MLDRSLYEDIDIFANYWMSRLNLEDNKKELYTTLSHYILNKIPEPDLIIYCRSSVETCEARIHQRQNRDFENKYPINFISDIAQLYESWFQRLKNIPIVVVDTELNDLNKATINKTFLKEFEYLLTAPIAPISQMNLFASDMNIEDGISYQVLKLQYDELGIKTLAALKRRLAKPTIYIAAPFTAFATTETAMGDLFSKEAYGTIGEDYKKILIAIQDFFKNLELNTFLPHEDVNKWGNVKLTSKEVFNGIVEAVVQSNVVFAIPTSSIGVHLELGIALGLQKKIIVVEVKELQSSFFVNGFTNRNDVYYLQTESLSTLLQDMKKSKVSAFIRRMFREEVL